MYNRSAIVRAANKLTVNGLTRSQAFKRVWELAKGKILVVKGVTEGKRQIAIEHIKEYTEEEVAISLERDKKNFFDNKTIKVVVTIHDKSYCVGYIASNIAEWLSKVIDFGTALKGGLRQIVGGNGFYYGLRINAVIG